MGNFTDQAIATLLISLRVAPTFAFAQPFTLTRVPAIIRLILSISLAGWLVAGNPVATWRSGFWNAGLPFVAANELFLGVTLALGLQLAFAAVLMAGRTIDIQAGFGLAVLVDPTTRANLPLVGTVLAYLGGAIFFVIGGPIDLLAIWAMSVDRIPMGAAATTADPGVLIDYTGAVFLMAIGLAGLVLLVLFILDVAIAFLSRTMPQMNVLLLGFQVKAIATLAVLTIALPLSGALFVRLFRLALDSMPRML